MKRELRDLYYSYLPKDNYFQYLEGNVPVVISAPHGGGMKPRNIPRRKSGKRGMDTYTRRLTNKIYELSNYIKPYCLISDLHRSRLDLNRELEDASDGNRKANEIWKTWNEYLQTILYTLRDTYGEVLYIDIHSHNDNNTFQLGYDLSAQDYNEFRRLGETQGISTLDSINSDTFEMLFGDGSFKQVLEFYGYSVYKPVGHEVYFNGGRNIEVYSGNGIGAIQIECPVDVLKTELDRVAESIITGYRVFLLTHMYANFVTNPVT